MRGQFNSFDKFVLPLARNRIFLVSTMQFAAEATWAQPVGDQVMPKVDAKYFRDGKEVPWVKTTFPKQIDGVDAEWFTIKNIRTRASEVVLLQEAEGEYKGYFATNPQDYLGPYGLGLVYQAQAARDEALTQFAAAFKLDEGRSEVYRQRRCPPSRFG